MGPVLFDTSVWVNYLRGTISPQTDLLAEYIFNDYEVLLCPTVIQEVLQGITDDRQFAQVKNSILGFACLTWSPVEAAVYAAGLYRNLRVKGITIRKSNDCLIASFALKFDLDLCHEDSDFDLIATKIALKAWKP